MSGFDKTTQSPLTGRVLSGRYRLVALIARGGMAEVWEGYDEVLSRPVAVKVLRADLAADDVFRERFRREAITAARLAHPGIVATFDTGVDDGTAYIVMELVRGQNLRQMLDQEGSLDPWRATMIASQVADALDHSHQARLVHRDIKPANVLILEDGSYGPRVKVTDFGIAKAGMDAGADLTRTGMVLGTPKYLSPEQIRGGDPDARADIYALGVVLYEMLVGRPPFAGDNDMATALAHLSEKPPKPSSSVKAIPQKLDRLVIEMLAKTPAKRVQSAAEVRDRIDDLGLSPAGLGTGTRPVDATRLLGRRRDPTPRHGSLNGSRNGTRTTPAHARNGHSAATRFDGGYGNASLAERIDATTSASPDRTDMLDAAGADAAAGRGGPARSAKGPSKRRGTGPSKSGPRHYLRSERTIGIVVLTLVVVGVVVGATLLSGGGSGGSSPTTTGARAVPVDIASVSVYMVADRPPDNPSRTPLTMDGNPSTFWSTDQYRTPTFSGLYPGIGLVIHLKSGADLHSLGVTSATHGWSASAYVSSTAVSSGQPVSAWGTATATKSGIDGSTTLSLGGHHGKYVLLWITNLGPADQAEVAELKVTGSGG